MSKVSDGYYLQDIINVGPPFIMRWGNLILFLIMLVVLSISFMIQTSSSRRFNAAIYSDKQPVKISIPPEAKVTYIVDHNVMVRKKSKIAVYKLEGYSEEMILLAPIEGITLIEPLNEFALANPAIIILPKIDLFLGHVLVPDEYINEVTIQKDILISLPSGSIVKGFIDYIYPFSEEGFFKCKVIFNAENQSLLRNEMKVYKMPVACTMSSGSKSIFYRLYEKLY